MAIQTLNTIKQWFKTGFKPTQTQFWDTWDSFRHKFEKVPVKDIEGIDELLLTKADKTVLDNHLADKNAHAPQVNTDWNSESGLSQLLNKPEFKTINGEEIVGDGDITITSAVPTLDQVLNSDNKSLTQPIVFLDEEYSATIDSKSLSIDGPLGEDIQYNGDNINWSKGDKNLKLIFDGESAGQNTFSFPEMPDSSTPYKLATDQLVSATQSGLVDNTSLQELGGVDKLINGVRIGKGGGNDPENSSFGLSALSSNTTGTANTAIGSEALLSNISAKNNTAIGNWALRLNQTSPSNTALGVNTLTKLLSGVGFNTAVGASALGDLTTGNQNVAIGASALRRAITGNFNMAIGNNTLSNLTTTNNNTAIGANAGTGITGAHNTAVGFLSNGTSAVSSGSYNTTLGYQSGGQLTTGGGNVLIGSYANNAGTGFSTGNNNIAISSDYWYTGVTTGSNNTLVGNIRGLSANDSNLIILADGSQNVAIRKEADNRLLAPTLTNTLIDSGGAKSLVTKEYLDAHSGGGGSQNLQQVLDVGKTATYSNSYGSGSVEILGQSGDFKFNEFVTSGGTTDKTYFTQLPSSVGMRSQDLSDGSEGNVRVSYGKPTLHRFFNGNSMFVELQDPIASNTLRFPAKSGEDVTYDIATTDDITLQKALENGAIGTLDGHIKLSSEHGDGEASLSMAVSEQLGGGSILQDVKLTGTDGIRNSRLSIMNGRMNIFTGNELGGSTSLDLEAFDYVNSTNFSFPDVGGNRVIATTDDFKTINGESIIGEGDIEIGGSSQNLQQVLDSGNTAQQGTSSNLVARYDLTELGLNTLSTKRVDTERSVSSIQNLAENLYLSNYYSPTDNITDSITSKIDFNLGNLEISQNINGGSGQNTKVRFETPLNTDVNLLFPTKNQNGTYKLATTDDISLQKVVDNTALATKGTSYANILGSGGYGIGTRFFADNEQVGVSHRFSELNMDSEYVGLSNSRKDNDEQTAIELNNGNISFEVKKDMLTSPKNTRLSFEAPIAGGVEIMIPAKPQRPEQYVIATLDDVVPKITYTTANVTIPNGSNTRMITVNASGLEVTLPAVSDAIGAIFYITAAGGDLTIKSNSGGSDIWYQTMQYSEYSIYWGGLLQLINDGINYKIVQLIPL